MPENRPRLARRALEFVVPIGLILLVILAAAWQGIPQFRPGPLRTEPPEQPEVTQPPSSEPPEPGELVTPEQSISPLLVIIGTIFLSILAVVLLRALILLIQRLIRERPPARRPGVEVTEFEAVTVPSEEFVAEAVRTGVAGAIERIQRSGPASDAIVAAWLGLEQSATEIGLERAAAETATEFALRLIARREDVAEHAETLLALYERVRFGGHTADESDRGAALSALRAIEREWR